MINIIVLVCLAALAESNQMFGPDGQAPQQQFFNPQNQRFNSFNPQNQGFNSFNPQNQGFNSFNPQNQGINSFNPQNQGFAQFNPQFGNQNSMNNFQDRNGMESFMRPSNFRGL